MSFSQTESHFDFLEMSPYLCLEGWWYWSRCLPAHKSTECLHSLHPLSIFSDSCCSLKLALVRVFTPWKSGNSGNQGLFFFPRDSCQTFTNIPLGAWIHNECMVFKNVPLIHLKETNTIERNIASLP